MTRPQHFFAVIPAGGSGSRLWPRSRRSSPKHLLPLSGTGKPLVLEAYERIAPLAAETLILTEASQLPLLSGLMPGLDSDDLIVEPAARGTTNAIGLAALTLLERDPDAVMLSLAADHVIKGAAAYRAAVRDARRVAEATGELVAVGLQPTYPATGFGYIEAGAEVKGGRWTARRADRFTEKPSHEQATEYLASGRHFWNLNMFCFRCQAFAEELRQHGPEHYDGLIEVLRARRRGDEPRAEEIYRRLPNEAVDYTVMERTRRLLLVPAQFEWADVGSWSDFAGLLPADPQGNHVEGDSVLIDTAGSYVSAPGKLVAVIGLRDVIVVDTPDALLICPKGRAQEVKNVVQALGRDGLTEYL